jgi:hypothetical protein
VAIKGFLNKRRYQAYRMVFENPEGKMVLTDMCRAHGVFDGGFDPDPYLHAFAAGERNAVLRILTILNLNAHEIAELTRED